MGPESNSTFKNDEGLSRPDFAAGKLQRVLLKLLREHERDGALPTNGRFLFYELIGLKVVSKQKKSKGRRSDQNMHDALTHLREKGIVPWSWIADETRSLADYTGWRTIADWATTMVEVHQALPVARPSTARTYGEPLPVRGAERSRG